MFRFISAYSTEGASSTTLKQFFDFRNRSGSFDKARTELWLNSYNPRLFWNVAKSTAPELAVLAERLAQTPATSVASERAFSSMNFLYSNTRNRLGVEKVNKVLYIYIN